MTHPAEDMRSRRLVSVHMKRWIEGNKLLVKSTCALLLCLAIIWTLYGVFGHRLIEARYKSEWPGIFVKLMEERARIPLEDYYKEADRIMWVSTVRIVTLFLVFAVFTVLVKSQLLGKAATIASSLLLSHFLLFCLFERFPSLIKGLHLEHISYYAIKSCCVSDEKLVFREIPSSANADFKGDRYSPLYMVDAPSIHMKWSSDKDGFRHNHPAKSSDIVVIGDSYIAMGENEADTFGRRLERLSGLSVQNLGVGGYGPFQYLEVLKKHGVPKKPKYVLFCFYEGNDIRDIGGYLAWKETGKYNGRYFLQPFLGKYVTALSDEISYLWSTGWTTIQFVANKIQPRKIHPDVAIVNLGNRNYNMFFHYKTDSRPVDEIIRSTEWRQLKKILADFKDISEQNRIKPIIMYIPSTAHIYAQYSTEESGENWLKIRWQQVAAKANMEDAMIRVSNELHIKLASLTPVFEAAARDGKLLYYPFDTHWNSTGREIASTFMASILKK